MQGAEPAVLDGMTGLWDRVQGAAARAGAACRSTRASGRGLISSSDLAARGFAPYLLFPGYFSRALGRQVQLDVVFYRQ